MLSMAHTFSMSYEICIFIHTCIDLSILRQKAFNTFADSTSPTSDDDLTFSIIMNNLGSLKVAKLLQQSTDLGVSCDW